MTLQDKIILALDTPSLEVSENLIEQTKDYIGFYKIGLGALAHGGIEFAEKNAKNGIKVFLDLKLFDIHQTIYNAVFRIANMGVKILTVHGDPHIVEAAAKAKIDSGRNDFSIFAVTVLTSLDENDLQKMLYTIPVNELVLQRAKLASEAGADGVIASGHEVKAIKNLVPNLEVITPGIRSGHNKTHDQKRVMSPIEALNAGADHLVIGRQITNAPSPALEAQNILKEIGKI